MTDETPFLRSLIAHPGDAPTRLAYADWLDERQDPRAAYLRLDPELGRLSYVEWLERGDGLEYYLTEFSDVRREWEERKKTETERSERRELQKKLDPYWTAFIDSLGCRFEPFLFFNNTGSNVIRPDELTFTEPIGTRGNLVTFESDFCDELSWSQGLMTDIRFLAELECVVCYYGAASCPTHPFLCEFTETPKPTTATDILAALRPSQFRDRHVKTLKATHIPYSGYHPGRKNDEIHNDCAHQKLFPEDDREREHYDEFDRHQALHDDLKRYVVDGKLWYVLLHCAAIEYDFPNYVVLFAVGLSPHGGRLVGVVAHQLCHNLCD